MRILLMILCLLSFSTPAFADSFTITTTATQDAALQWVVDARNVEITRDNAVRVAKQPPEPAVPLETVERYLQARMSAVLDSYSAQYQAATDERLKKAALNASDAVKAQVKNLLTCGQVVCP